MGFEIVVVPLEPLPQLLLALRLVADVLLHLVHEQPRLRELALTHLQLGAQHTAVGHLVRFRGRVRVSC